MSRRGQRQDRVLDFIENCMRDGVEAGVIRLHVDGVDGGESITVDGKRMVNFGSCSYLGLNTDERLKRAAVAAVEHFGPLFSSSAMYASLNLYRELQVRLERIFGGHVVLPQTTTLGHLAALPVLVSPDDIVAVDVKAHASVHLATSVLRSRGVGVTEVPHNDVPALEAFVAEAASEACRVWYLADSIYSMYGDTAPVLEIQALMERYPTLHVYYDDAHGFSWCGPHGCGYVLDKVPFHQRMVIAVGMAKSFGSGGAALAFPTAEMARRVQLTGGPLTFSGPIHSAELGAAVAAADIHLSPEHAERRVALYAQMDLVRRLLIEHRLPVMSYEQTPLWFVRLGRHDQAIDMTKRLMKDGFYVNPAAYPAVARGYAGVRFAHTLHHTDDQISSLIEAMARHLPEVVDDVEVLIDLTAEQAASA